MRKKLLITLLLCFMCLNLVACDPTWYTYDYEELTDNVVKVELINYDNPEAKSINTSLSSGKIRKFDFKKMEIIETLEEEKLDDFLQDWAEIQLWTRMIHSDSPTGISIRIIYSNDEFDVFSYANNGDTTLDFGVKFNRKGKFKKNVGSVDKRSDFVDIINNYFITQIE